MVKKLIVVLGILASVSFSQMAKADDYELPAPTSQETEQATADFQEAKRIISERGLKIGETRTVVSYGENPYPYVLSPTQHPGWDHSQKLQKGLSGNVIYKVPVFTPFGVAMQQRLMRYANRPLPRGPVCYADRAVQSMDYDVRGKDIYGHTEEGEPYINDGFTVYGKVIKATLLADGQTVRLEGIMLIQPKADWFCGNTAHKKVASSATIVVPYNRERITETVTKWRTRVEYRDSPSAPPAPSCAALPRFVITAAGRKESPGLLSERVDLLPESFTWIQLVQRQFQKQTISQPPPPEAKPPRTENPPPATCPPTTPPPAAPPAPKPTPTPPTAPVPTAPNPTTPPGLHSTNPK